MSRKSNRLTHSIQCALLTVFGFTITYSLARFEPYQLNGGLLAAISGSDYCIVACDTRLIGEGGYDILSRRHVASRLWSALDLGETPNLLLQSDGSLCLSEQHKSKKEKEAITLLQEGRVAQNIVFIASAGCQSDCETLKRIVRAELRLTGSKSYLPPTTSQVANLLSQVLYSRRGFPYYSFCIVAGIGKVYVYDAIGSYEAVQAATAGTGRELLQPILDRRVSNNCSIAEAIDCLVEGYRSVSEREISVGDAVVLLCLRQEEDGIVEYRVYEATLKSH